MSLWTHENPLGRLATGLETGEMFTEVKLTQKYQHDHDGRHDLLGASTRGDNGSLSRAHRTDLSQRREKQRHPLPTLVSSSRPQTRRRRKLARCRKSMSGTLGSTFAYRGK